MALSQNIEHLKNVRCEQGVLTIYLNTLRTNSEWKLRLKNGLKKWQEYIEARGDEQQLKDFIKLKKKILQEIKDQQLNLQKSIVIFASVDGSVWEVHHLQLNVENEFHWETYPVVDQLEKIQKQYPATGIIVVKPQKIVAINTSLGEIIDEQCFHLNENKAEEKNMERKEYDETSLLRSLKEVAPKINQLAQMKKWKGIYVVGKHDFVNEMKKHLKVNLVKVVTKNLCNKSAKQIVGEILT